MVAPAGHRSSNWTRRYFQRGCGCQPPVCQPKRPLMTFKRAQYWAQCWGGRLIDLGDAGHINAGRIRGVELWSGAVSRIL
ncbi:MAG: alpha/beta hydrolase [Enterobacteriaceae bacterium]